LVLKKATIVISLIEESNDLANLKIGEEIRKELSENLSLIPWSKEIVKVKVK
jgi:hypothetical protein